MANSTYNRRWARIVFRTLLAVIVLSLAAVIFRVDLTPRVESDFFFSTDDPAFQASRRISELFPAQPQLILSARGQDIESPEYLERIGELSAALSAVPEVTAVQSLTSGPSHPAAVPGSPVWSRLLLSVDPLADRAPAGKLRASQLVVSVDHDAGVPPEGGKRNTPEGGKRDTPEAGKRDGLIQRIEQIITEHNRPSFDLEISGVPYVVELIRRYLLRDLRVFSVAAFLVFGAVISLLYRKVPPVAGTLLSCLGACLVTLTVLNLLDVPIGMLTANIATIVFVLTLSHTVFLTANWQRVRPGLAPEDAISRAVSMTFTASFWCMVAALSGFGSLLLANAKPLRELGTSGMVGTAVAIVVAYGFYPYFLRSGRGAGGRAEDGELPPATTGASSYLPGLPGPLAIAVLALVAALGLGSINTDPSVFAYFAEGSEIRTGLELFDRGGGSSPLYLVVKDHDGRRLDSSAVEPRLAELQEALEKQPPVGVSLSLSVLLAEARRVPLAAFLSTEQLVNILDSERYDHIARSFVDDERRRGLFFLRMRETGRSDSRRAIIEGLTGQATEAGFETELVGGLYDLQGKLGELVATSLWRELGGLLAFFVLVAAAVSRSARIAAAMVACLATVPILLLGTMGHLRAPVDVISAPGVNVAIALGIDAMIHLMMAVHRRRRAGDPEPAAWANACARMRYPIVGAMLILAPGFGIFVLSSFPPTQRFGLLVAAGTMISAFMALVVLPFLATAGSGSRA